MNLFMDINSFRILGIAFFFLKLWENIYTLLENKIIFTNVNFTYYLYHPLIWIYHLHWFKLINVTGITKATIRPFKELWPGSTRDKQGSSPLANFKRQKLKGLLHSIGLCGGSGRGAYLHSIDFFGSSQPCYSHFLQMMMSRTGRWVQRNMWASYSKLPDSKRRALN